MTPCRRRQWPMLLALLPALAGWVMQPLHAETDGAADSLEVETRIERLREAIEREREALERERETRRSMEEELEMMRDELERTREELEQLEREADPGTGAGN